MLISLRDNLTGLFHFSGRTTRSGFWPYAVIVILLSMAGLIGVMIPSMVDMFVRMQRFAAQHPELVTEIRGPGSYEMRIEGYHPELMPNFGSLFLEMGGVALGAILLLAAAVTRRLHDRDKSGWWALPPPVFLAIGFALMPYMFARFSREAPDMRLFFLLFFNNLTYLATLLLLVILLLGPGSSGPNRYGEQPD